MTNKLTELRVPDMGGAANVDVIDVLVSVGDTIAVDDSLITLEGDKASMDVPATAAGVVESIAVSVGDKVSEGSVICTVRNAASTAAESQAPAPTEARAPASAQSVLHGAKTEQAAPQKTTDTHASPAVRRLARELEIDLSKINGTGDKGRITKEDLKRHLSGGNGAGFSFPQAPVIDFSKFGAIESKPLSKIQKISGANLHRNWVSIPHVTQLGEADITDMEKFRQANKEAAAKKGYKLTPLIFIMKAVVAALKQFPHFNASLDANGESLILKKYFHIGVAVDTPNGLVVPVIRDVDQKSLFDLARELGEISEKARVKGLGISDMQGGCFTISSLGGIGGTAFTPIINAPEVAILGVSTSSYKPVYKANGEFDLKFMLPLSLSYDHRVIDGADGARFMVFLSQCLSDIRTLLL